MATQRQGQYGVYYGSPYDKSEDMTYAEMVTNARYIRTALLAAGWTEEAIAGLLGNTQSESSNNPGRWQSDAIGIGPGYGLTQWTHFTKYTNWCAATGRTDPSTMDNNIARILYEVENGIQFQKRTEFPLTFSEFTKSTEHPYYLACAFWYDYEQPGSSTGTDEEKQEAMDERGGRAEAWYTLLTGKTLDERPVVPIPKPGQGGSSSTKRRRLPVWMMVKRH